MQVICVGRERKYFLMGDWTTQITLIALAFSSSSRIALMQRLSAALPLPPPLTMQRQHCG
jgi:hypothetical protein